MDLEIEVTEKEIPPHALWITASNGVIRIAVSPRCGAVVLLALTPEIREYVVQAVEEQEAS